jgi:hypothetical protein
MTVSENPSTPRFVWPAEYYSTTVRAPILPKWAPFGCGGVAVLVLIVVFTGGAFLSSGGFIDLMDFVIGMTASEMKGQYHEVPAAQQKSLDEEVVLLRKNLREEKVSMVNLQPFLERVRDASADRKITTEETELLVDVARRINARAKK